MDKQEDHPIKTLSMVPLITVTLPTVFSFSSGGVVVGIDVEDHVWFEDRWMVASLCDE
jgi:hypothetical protein